MVAGLCLHDPPAVPGGAWGTKGLLFSHRPPAWQDTPNGFLSIHLPEHVLLSRKSHLASKSYSFWEALGKFGPGLPLASVSGPDGAQSGRGVSSCGHRLCLQVRGGTRPRILLSAASSLWKLWLLSYGSPFHGPPSWGRGAVQMVQGPRQAGLEALGQKPLFRKGLYLLHPSN